MRINVEALAADESEERDSGLFRQVDRQTGWRRDGDDDRNPGEPRLLHDLERYASADDEHAGWNRQVIEQQRSEDLIGRVVAADVLRRRHQIAASRKECNPVQPAGLTERRLRSAQP